MLLTVSKRLEFSASRRLFVPEWDESSNLSVFGPESSARYGTGRNYVAYFVFAGEVDSRTGMLMNISEIKDRVGRVLRDGFDHKFLNEDNKAFAAVPPTAENVARQLLIDAAPLFHASTAKLVACHLSESEEHSATFYSSGISESNYWFDFSAARQTMSPQLSNPENEKLFGVAASPFGHGHHYRARLTFRSESQDDLPPEYHQLHDSLDSLRKELDHKNLNREVPGLASRPITTECLANYLFNRAAAFWPVHRVRLHERTDFFAEYWKDDGYFLGYQVPFSAAHRLQSNTLSPGENAVLYGKCNNPCGHGHRYLTEATVGGAFDQRSGTLMDLEALQRAIAEAVSPWQDRHLDIEVEDFRDKPSTGENIVQALWPRVDSQLDGRLVRLRLWETPNNRFTLRTSRSF